MSLQPADLDLPLDTDTRASVLVRLISRDAVLQQLSAEHAAGSSSHVPGDVLSRWWALFRDEVQLVHDVRNLAVHGMGVPDPDLRRAAWLADQLVRIVLGSPDATLA